MYDGRSVSRRVELKDLARECAVKFMRVFLRCLDDAVNDRVAMAVNLGRKPVETRQRLLAGGDVKDVSMSLGRSRIKGNAGASLLLRHGEQGFVLGCPVEVSPEYSEFVYPCFQRALE